MRSVATGFLQLCGVGWGQLSGSWPRPGFLTPTSPSAGIESPLHTARAAFVPTQCHGDLPRALFFQTLSSRAAPLWPQQAGPARASSQLPEAPLGDKERG